MDDFSVTLATQSEGIVTDREIANVNHFFTLLGKMFFTP